MITRLVARAQDGVIGAMENPIEGIIPNFSVFGAEFTEWWQKLFGGLWAIAIIIAIVFLLQGVVTMASASDNPHDYAQGRGKAIKALIAVVILVGFGVIVAAIINVVG